MEWLKTTGRSVMSRSRLFLLLIVGLLIGLVSSTLVATTTFAADAKWDDGKIVYREKTYIRAADNDKLKHLNLSGDMIYVSEEADDVFLRMAQMNHSPLEWSVIHFANTNTLSEVTEVSISTYDLSPPNTFTLKNTATITIDPPQTSDTSSCNVEGGLGWFICPTTRFIAGGVDWMFDNILKGFLEIPHLEVNNTRSGLYIAWDIIRNFANAAFIIMFLVIIYSQVTSAGVSNYGIKKMLPRLIIAAITVNISFVLCAALLDISNIFGSALQEMFLNIRNTVATVGTSQQTAGWGSILGAVLAGGTAGGAAVIAGITFGDELIWFIGPALIGAAMIILIVIVILAARQALIVILITISPLAFVAYLLPGTEKWFDKWKDSFLTMLIFFPAFSAVFGGAQLAGTIIMQNASGANAAVMYILGMLVHIAPLAIVPLLMKLSGGVLNRFAGIMNDKRKGLFDRSMNWAKDNAAIRRHNKLANSKNPFNRLRRNFDHRARARKDRLAEAEKMAENAYHASERYKRLDLRSRYQNERASLLETQAAARYIEAQAGKLPADIVKNLRGRELKALNQQVSNIQTLAQDIAIAGMRKNNAERVHNKEFAEKLLASESMQKAAGGIYQYGADAAAASAVATMRQEYGKSVQEGAELIKHFNLSSDERQTHAKGGTVTATKNGITRVFNADNVFTQEAAIEEQIAVGTVDQVKEIVEISGSTLSEFRTTIAGALAKSGVKNKAAFMGGKLIDDIARGAIRSHSDLVNHVQEWVANGKFNAEQTASTDPQGLSLIIEAMKSAPQPRVQKPGESDADYLARSSEYQTKFQEGVERFQRSAEQALTSENINSRIVDGSEPLLQKIKDGTF